MRYFFPVLIFLRFFFSPSYVFASWADEILSSMSLEEKVGQLFVIPACEFRGEDHKQDLERLIAQCHIGGLILNQGTADGQVMLINRFQNFAKLPLLCVQDAEWGLQMRIAEVLAFPKNLTLGAIQDNVLLYRLGQQIGRQCALVGAHINTAPVVDVNSNPRNPIIHWRSFGDDPQTVAEKGMQIMLGMQSMGVFACAKHFPGHGDVEVDSHLDLPCVFQSVEHLEEVELFPFKKLIDAGVKTVMSAHISVPALDGYATRPATFSSQIIYHLLRRDLRFDGLIISDALNMQAISRYFDDQCIAEHAFDAGHDLLLYGDHLAPHIDRIVQEQVPIAFHHLVRQFKNKHLDEEELDRRVLKILKAKELLSLHRQRLQVQDVLLSEKINCPEAFMLKRLLFEKAVTLLENKGNLLPLKKNGGKLILIEQGSLFYFRDQLAQEQEVEVIHENDLISLEKIDRSYCVVFALSDLMLSKEIFGIKPAIFELMQMCEASGIPFIIAVFGTPYSLSILPKADGLLIAYERDKDAQEAAADAILGKINPTGKLPLSVCREYPLGSGISFSNY